MKEFGTIPHHCQKRLDQMQVLGKMGTEFCLQQSKTKWAVHLLVLQVQNCSILTGSESHQHTWGTLFSECMWLNIKKKQERLYLWVYDSKQDFSGEQKRGERLTVVYCVEMTFMFKHEGSRLCQCKLKILNWKLLFFGFVWTRFLWLLWECESSNSFILRREEYCEVMFEMSL